MSLKIARAPLEQLQEVLPRFLSRLSIGRAQIALEQLRSNLQNRPHDEILFYLAHEQPRAELPTLEHPGILTPLAALIAIEQPSMDQATSSDVATIVHADFLADLLGEVPKPVANKALPTDSACEPNQLEQSVDQQAVIKQMRSQIEHDFANRGIRFVQWATEATDQVEIEAQKWQEGLGFQQIATLDYLTGNANLTEHAGLSRSSVNHESKNPEIGVSIELRALDWNSEQRRLAFTKLVEATYAGTLDCPDLALFRTTSETIRGYQTAASYAPNLWFEVWDANSPDQTPIGCLILAKHGDFDENAQLMQSCHERSAPESNPTMDNELQTATTENLETLVIEIVYMGLLPETRGKGFGRQLVDQAVKVIANLGGSQFILGVDQTNQPARDIYDGKGMTRLLSETVWAKRVNSGNPRRT